MHAIERYRNEQGGIPHVRAKNHLRRCVGLMVPCMALATFGGLLFTGYAIDSYRSLAVGGLGLSLLLIGSGVTIRCARSITRVLDPFTQGYALTFRKIQSDQDVKSGSEEFRQRTRPETTVERAEPTVIDGQWVGGSEMPA